MTDPKQPLYDILGEAFKAGQRYYVNGDFIKVEECDDPPSAASILFPLAARMESELQKIVAARDDLWMQMLQRHVTNIVQEYHDFPSSPERET